MRLYRTTFYLLSTSYSSIGLVEVIADHSDNSFLSDCLKLIFMDNNY